MLEPEKLRQTLAARERVKLSLEGYVRSAVLLPLLLIDKQEHLLFTRRTNMVEHHKGQISFPGGRQDAPENPEQCALRETHEEIGVAPEHVTILGALDDTWTPTRYVITPFVGFIPYPYDFRWNQAEIDEALIIPMEKLLHPQRYEENSMSYEGRDATVPFYYVDEHVIWGATARMVRQFLALAYPEPM